MSLNSSVMGQRIKAARKMRNMSAETLAEKIGYAAESVNHIECGSSRPSLQTLYKIAEVLDASLDYLTGRTASSTDSMILESIQDTDLTDAQKEMLLDLTKSMIPIVKRKV